MNNRPLPDRTRSPDENARGLSDAMPNALRYDGHTAEVAEVAGLMRRAMPRNSTVLDVGCGTGGLTLIVNEGKGNRVIGLEPDEIRAKVARDRGIEVVTGEFNDDFLKNRAPFDVIVLADVIEHLPAPAGALQAAFDGLRAGGLVLISVPNVAHWSVRVNLLIGRFNYEDFGIMDSTHLRWFTEETLRSLIKNAGFEAISVQQAAGTKLPVYYRTFFRFIPRGLLQPAVRCAARAMPRLFGSQHVVVARKPNVSTAGETAG